MGMILPGSEQTATVTTDTPSSGDSHDITDSGDRYEALLEVLEHQKAQLERDRAREASLRAPRRRRGTGWLVGVLTAIAVWLWLVPPAPLRIEPPPPQPVAEEEEALRFIMSIQARRLEAFRRVSGRYPSSLEETGPPLPGVRYARLHDDLYQITGTTDRLTLTYRSDLPLDDFADGGPDAALDSTNEP